jgi:hypothetical protein
MAAQFKESPIKCCFRTEKTLKIAECQIRTVQGMVLRFRIELCSEFRICCAVPSVGRSVGRYHVEDHSVGKKTGRFVLMASRKPFSGAQYWSAFTARPCAGKSTSSTLEESKDTGQHLPANGVTVN